MPLIYGMVRKQTALAIGGVIACIAAGFVLGVILALPVAILFAWLIWRTDRSRTAAATHTEASAAGNGRFDRPAADRSADREAAGRF